VSQAVTFLLIERDGLEEGMYRSTWRQQLLPMVFGGSRETGFYTPEDEAMAARFWSYVQSDVSDLINDEVLNDLTLGAPDDQVKLNSRTPTRIQLRVPALEELRARRSLPVGEAAEILQIKPRTIRYWQQNGKLNKTPRGRIAVDTAFEAFYLEVHQP